MTSLRANSAAARSGTALLMLAAATGLVLLMACANVAGLLLARGIALRRALGAGTGRIVRQLLTESVVLSLAGGALGLAVTAAIMRSAPAMVPRRVPGLDQVGVDGNVLAFATALSIGAGLLFGAAPALAWARADLVPDPQRCERAGGRWLRAPAGEQGTEVVLATGQVALALVLLTAAGLLLRSFVALVTFDLGFGAAQCRHRPRCRTLPPSSTCSHGEATG